MRAVVDNPELLDVAGTSPRVVRRWAWIIGASFASASGRWIGPLIATLNPITLTSLVVTAFGAAAIGGFTSLPMTYAGGLVIGLGQAFCSKYFVSGFWTGLAPALPFLVLFAVLLASPRRGLAERSLTITGRRSTRTTPLPLHVPGGLGALGLLLFGPSFAGFPLTAWTDSPPMLIPS